MNGLQVAWVGVLLPVSLLIFFGMLWISNKVYRRVQNRGFDLRSEFPFELMDGRDPSLRLGRAFLILWAGLDSVLGLYLLVTLSQHSSLLVMACIYFVGALLKNISLVFLFFIPAFHFKPHFLSFVSSCGLTAFSSATGVIVALNMREINFGASLAFVIVLGALGLFAMLIMVNPKLANWAKLDSSVDESGAVVERRPKYFVLAFSEWLTLFTSILLSILSLVAFLVFDLLYI